MKQLMNKIEEAVEKLTKDDIGKSLKEIFPEEMFDREVFHKIMEDDSLAQNLSNYGEELFFNIWKDLFENIKLEGDIHFKVSFEISGAKHTAMSAYIDNEISELDQVIIFTKLDELEQNMLSENVA